jgi:hypothetical protein
VSEFEHELAKLQTVFDTRAHELEELGKLQVTLKMAGKAGDVAHYKYGPGFVFRCWWQTGSGGRGFEEDEYFEELDELKKRVHAIATGHIAARADPKTNSIDETAIEPLFVSSSRWAPFAELNIQRAMQKHKRDNGGI